MKRLDFATVMAVLRRNIPDENFENQTDFLYSLFPDVVLKCCCRILFTTRSRYENHISLAVGERNPDTLLELMRKFFPEAEKRQNEISRIIELLHGHTFAVELAARLLVNGMLKPKANWKGKKLPWMQKIRSVPPRTAETGKLPAMTIFIICFLSICAPAQNRRFFAA